mmetsp:Transcript_2322/g.3844  ORF Transcript_2322/g.3844 Transcript_2322/m.3844 type:complete len:325 (+) Transcript_2322:24-998(+)
MIRLTDPCHTVAGSPSHSRHAVQARAACGNLVDRRAFLSMTASVLLATLPLRPAHAEVSPSDIYARYTYQRPQDILGFVRDQAPAGDAEATLAAIDEFSVAFPMYKIGAEKGLILEQLVRLVQPQLVVELGSFIGYSAVRIARNLPPGARLVCVEANAECVEAMEGVLRHAGLRERVVIEQGLASDVVPRLAQQYGVAQLLFEDHCKQCYEGDLITAEKTGLLGPGSWLIADNVLYPGAPELLAHLADSKMWSGVLAPAKYEYDQAWNPSWEAGKPDAMAVAVRTVGLSQAQTDETAKQLQSFCGSLATACQPLPLAPILDVQT